MRTDVFFYTGKNSQFLYNSKNHNPCETGTPPVQEQDVFLTFFNNNMRPEIRQIIADLTLCNASDGNKTLFIPLAGNLNKTIIKKEV